MPESLAQALAASLIEHRTAPPEPDLGLCRICGQEIPFHLFSCPRYVEEEERYQMAGEGFECYVCRFPKPHHDIDCFRGADFGPRFRDHYTPDS